MYEIWIDDRVIGQGRPTFIIAELGYSFNSLDEALCSVDAAAECGVDALKLQTFRADTVVIRGAEFPEEAGGVNQYEEFKRYEISEETHAAIFERCRRRGIIGFSTPAFYDDVELLERLGCPLHKIGSDDLTNLPFLRYVAGKGKPVIFSSGMSTLAEVDEAIRVFHEAGNTQLVLLHCVSNYPVKDPSVMNLRVIESYRKAFSVLVGFSDHTTSIASALGAIALGAVVIERHFVLDKKLPAPDAFFSADPREMADLVKSVRELESMLGDGFKRPAVTEGTMRLETRKSLVARRAISKGQPVSLEDVIIKRPGTGIAPRDLERALGRPAKCDIQPDEVISWDMV